MISPSDIRKGVLVTVNNEKYHPKLKGVILEVSGISETYDLFDQKTTYSIALKHINRQPNTYYETYSQFIKFVQPIPLTTEILDKFGFEFRLLTKYMGYYSPTINGRSIRIWEEGTDCFCYSINEYETINLMYVHELQNLHYVLMRQELIYNPEKK